jgi:hypothetical protein
LIFKHILFPVHDPKSIGSKEAALSPHNFLEVYVLKSLMCSPNGRGLYWSWAVGYSDFNNLMDLISKKLQQLQGYLFKKLSKMLSRSCEFAFLDSENTLYVCMCTQWSQNIF